MLALEGLAARVGLIVTGSVSGIADEVGKASLGVRDLPMSSAWSRCSEDRTSASSLVVHGLSSSRTSSPRLPAGLRAAWGAGDGGTAFLAGAAFFATGAAFLTAGACFLAAGAGFFATGATFFAETGFFAAGTAFFAGAAFFATGAAFLAAGACFLAAGAAFFAAPAFATGAGFLTDFTDVAMRPLPACQAPGTRAAPNVRYRTDARPVRPAGRGAAPQVTRAVRTAAGTRYPDDPPSNAPRSPSRGGSHVPVCAGAGRPARA